MLKRKHDADDGGRKPVDAYSRLARIYDHVMRHVDYDHWVDYVESVFSRHAFLPRRLADLACGTGTFALELASRGYVVSGVDGSEAMVMRAREKAGEAEGRPVFETRNLLDLGGLATYEGAVCLYDSLNYMMTLEDLATALDQVRSLVEPDGLFVFDVCTETNSLAYFRDMTNREKGDGFSYVRRSFYDEGVQVNAFEIRFEGDDAVYYEEHRQRIYPLEEVEQTVERSRFKLEAAYDGFGFSEPSELSDRVHFVLRA